MLFHLIMIKVFEKKVADKIAAGEVIERSLSVVKELVENSIDAGATSIVCEIKKGGKEYIRVTDNGAGIPAEEVATAFLRHATSKIDSAGDLNAIRPVPSRPYPSYRPALFGQSKNIPMTNKEE